MSKPSGRQPAQGNKVSGQQSKEKEVAFSQIIVLGETGAGKSTLINKLVGRGRTMEVGETLKGCTHSVQVATIEHLGRSFDVVDTPGFNEGSEEWPDSKLFKIFTDWLRETHKKNQIAAIIYVHDISQPIDKPTFWMIKELCGEASFGRIVIVTTKWDKKGAAEVNVNTEKDLMKGIWGEIMKGGAKTFRWSHTDSVGPILDHISSVLKAPISELKIQNEMNTQKKPLEKTSAWKHIRIHKKLSWWQNLKSKLFK